MYLSCRKSTDRMCEMLFLPVSESLGFCHWLFFPGQHLRFLEFANMLWICICIPKPPFFGLWTEFQAWEKQKSMKSLYNLYRKWNVFCNYAFWNFTCVFTVFCWPHDEIPQWPEVPRSLFKMLHHLQTDTNPASLQQSSVFISQENVHTFSRSLNSDIVLKLDGEKPGT